MEEELNEMYDLCVKIGVATVRELLEDEEEKEDFAKESEDYKAGFRQALTLIDEIDFVISERQKQSL